VVLISTIGLWAVASVGWILLIAAERALMGPTSCEYQDGDSYYGEASWTWLPPGATCEWHLRIDGRTVDVIEQPPEARLGVAVALALWGASLIAIAVLVLPRPRDDHSRDPRLEPRQP